VKSESKSDIANNRGDWNHFRITQTIAQQHAREARDQENTKKN